MAREPRPIPDFDKPDEADITKPPRQRIDKEQMLWNEKMVDLHRRIKDQMKSDGFEYVTGTYGGLEDAEMNFINNTTGEKATLHLIIHPKEPGTETVPPKR